MAMQKYSQQNLPQTPQHSLEAPPVYRRFLAGGTQSLRLSAYEVTAIAGLGILTCLLSTLLVGSRPAWEIVSGGTAATIAALITAAIAANWLGRRVGLFCGCLFLLSAQVLLATASSSATCVAARIRTSTATSSCPPTGLIFPSCSKRSKLICADSGMSPISSRKSVPFSA